MLLTHPLWRHFQDLSSPCESVSAAAGCHYSLGTLEVSASDPGVARFALTEQQHSGSWRWTIFSAQGAILGSGSEPTQALAKCVAEQALAWNRTKIPFSMEEGIF